jgi:hypothetical protein
MINAPAFSRASICAQTHAFNEKLTDITSQGLKCEVQLELPSPSPRENSRTLLWKRKKKERKNNTVLSLTSQVGASRYREMQRVGETALPAAELLDSAEPV